MVPLLVLRRRSVFIVSKNRNTIKENYFWRSQYLVFSCLSPPTCFVAKAKSSRVFPLIERIAWRGKHERVSKGM